MPEYLYPGVYVEEVDTGNKPIEGVSTSTVGFLGVTERGPLVPTLVTSFSEFTRLYGSYHSDGASQRYLAYAMEGFFQNGGRRAFVARVTGSSATAATETFGGKIKVTALGPGSYGLRIAVRIVRHTPEDDRFDLFVMYFKDPLPAGPLVDPTDPANAANVNRREPTILEIYEGLTDIDASSGFYEKRINGYSSLVTVSKAAAGLPAQAAAALLTTAGVDDTTYVLDDFTGNAAALVDPTKPIGLTALKGIDEISILTCPDEHAIAAVTDAVVTQCELTKDRFAILNSPENAGPIGAHQASKRSKYAAYYYPWLKVIDPSNGKVVTVPPSGHVAGIYARSDNERGVHKDPANEVIRGIDSLQVQLSNDQQALLNPRGINVLRNFIGAGDLVWGGRTTSTDPDWKYINVRRLFIFVEDSIAHGTGWVVFEPNDYPTWTKVVRSVTAFLERLWMDGMLQGRTKEEAFFVRCDRTTMTQSDIDNGRLICLIGIAPVKPAEFVIFRIGQYSGGSDVTEQ